MLAAGEPRLRNNPVALPSPLRVAGAMPPAALRSSFAPETALTPFYTGGACRLSPDGRTLATACGDDAQLVDAAGGTVVATLTGDSEPVTALAFRRVQPCCERLTRAAAAAALALRVCCR
jgi:hypothetical protein